MELSEQKPEALPQEILAKLKNLPPQQVILTPEEMCRTIYWMAKSTSESSLDVEKGELRSETRVIGELGMRLERLAGISLDEILDELMQQKEKEESAKNKGYREDDAWKENLSITLMAEVLLETLACLAKGVAMGKLFCKEELVRHALDVGTTNTVVNPSEELLGRMAELDLDGEELEELANKTMENISRYLDKELGEE